jgi:hypothetical protein
MVGSGGCNDGQLARTENGAGGMVENTSSVIVDVFVEVQFFSANDVMLDDSLDTVRGLRPGESSVWTARYLGRGEVARCRAGVSRVFER